MTRFRPCRLAVPLLALLLPVAAFASERPPSRVIFEFGWAAPRGDLGEDFAPEVSPDGFGADDGLELGFRWRYHLSPAVSLSPGFHVIDFRDYRSTATGVGDYRVAVTSLRYTAELMVSPGRPGAAVRPFVAVGAGWFRNRIVGVDKAFRTVFEESINTLGFTLRAGLRWNGFEFSAVYGVNRFETWRLFRTGEAAAYDFDSVGARVGWIIPFGDGPGR